MINSLLRLNVYLAHAGLCSRRAADELIKKGEITINHAVVTNPGYQVREDKDTVRHKKQVIKIGSQPLVTYVLNKPENYITTVSDEYNRPTVMELVDTKNRVYPVGRLDYSTSGVLLMTNDGELAQLMAHPKYHIKKIYVVTLAKDLSQEHFEIIKKGLFLHDGPIRVDHIEYMQHKKCLRVTIHSGRNRIVRRIFEALGNTVRKLDRVSFAGISKRGLQIGQTRELTQSEVDKLKLQAKEGILKPAPARYDLSTFKVTKTPNSADVKKSAPRKRSAEERRSAVRNTQKDAPTKRTYTSRTSSSPKKSDDKFPSKKRFTGRRPRLKK